MSKRRLTIIIVGIFAVIIIVVGIDYFVLSKPSSPDELTHPTEEIKSPAPAEEIKSPSEPSAPVITMKTPAEQPLSTFEQKMKNLKGNVDDLKKEK